MNGYITAFVVIVLLCGGCFSVAGGAEDFSRERNEMVDEQLAGRGLNDERVLEAMRAVPRHLFVPKQQEKWAYEDSPLPIGYGQTISQPYIVAYMTEQLELKSGDRVLEIGTGSGYQAAVLAELVEEVYSIEIVPELAEQAANNLARAGYKKVQTRQGDGYQGWPEAAPFDAIIITAAAESIPAPLVEQLAPGGKLIMPKGPVGGYQELILAEKVGDTVKTRSLLPVRFVPFTREGDE